MTESDPNGGLCTNESNAQSLAEASVNALTVDEGAFMNLTSAIQGIHLKVWVTIASSGTLRMESIALSDERALVHAAGRLFAQGSAEEATKQIRQAQTGFDRKKAEWERRVRQSEDDSARRRAMRELQQKKGYHSPITSRITPAENQFRRLVEALDIHLTLERKRELAAKQQSLRSASPVSTEREAIALPLGFLEAFCSADASQHTTIVKQFFDMEAELTVEVVSAEPKQVSVTFQPPLPKNRLYYFVDADLIIRLRRVKISSDVFYHDVVTQQNKTMSLQSVIESVQRGGVWLLEPKLASIIRE